MADSTSAKRKPVTKRLRYEILKRDGHRCHYCGATADDGPLVVDHVIPVALGGPTEPTNLVTACRDCNAGKSSTNPDDDLVANVDSLAIAMADALRLVNQQRMEDRDALESDVRHFRHLWDNWHDYKGNALPLPGGWQATIERFLGLGLDDYDFEKFIEIAMGSKARQEGVFAYFCGVCWNTIREMQDKATEIMTADLEDTYPLPNGDGSPGGIE